jgi:hypothetical protein
MVFMMTTVSKGGEKMRYFVIMGLLAFVAVGAYADTLWDNGAVDGLNGLSCGNWPEYPLNREVVDDFTVGDPGWLVYDGHFNIVTYSGYGPSAIRAVNAIFYQDVGNIPSTTAYATKACQFSGSLTGNYYFSRPEIAVDVTFDTVTLAPGKWWVCFQPDMNDNNFWLTSAYKGHDVYVSYPDLGYPKWTDGYTVFGVNYDVNFKLTGTMVPEPGVVSLAGLLLGAAALWLRRK